MSTVSRTVKVRTRVVTEHQTKNQVSVSTKVRQAHRKSGTVRTSITEKVRL